MVALSTDSHLSPGEYFTMGLFMTAEGILGVLCCGLLLVSCLYSNKKTNPAQSSLIMNLAISDMGIAVMCPFAASASFAESWPFGDTGCQIYAFFGMFFGIASVTSLAALSVDTYQESQRQRVKSNSFTIMTIWGNALFWATAPLNPFHWGRYTKEPFGTSCLLDFADRDLLYLAYLVVMVSTCFVIPVGAMFYCALNVKEEKKKICMMMLLSFVVYWGMYAFVAVVAGFGSLDAVSVRLFAMAPVMAKLAPVGDSLLITWINQQALSMMTNNDEQKVK